MTKNGVTFSMRECEILLELINMGSIEFYKKLNHEQLNLITNLRFIVRDDPIGDHIELYHSD
jgi:hypothetical protein